MFGVHALDFLGYRLDANGIRPLDQKVQVIRDFPLPTSQRKLHKFLGLVNFNRQFIPHCAATVMPITDLLKGGNHSSDSLTWSDSATAAFDNIRQALADATLLVHPTPDTPTCLMPQPV